MAVAGERVFEAKGIRRALAASVRALVGYGLVSPRSDDVKKNTVAHHVCTQVALARYDPVAFAVLLIGIGVIELLASII
jgi:hypothetical protein